VSARPDIELALDVRSYEKVIVIAAGDSTFQYPEHWIKPSKLSDLDEQQIGGSETLQPSPDYPLAMSVVVVDRVEVQRKTLAQLADGGPRLFAFAVANVDHEKQVRRMVTSLFPWNEVWTVYTSFGKLLVTKDAVGKAYDRSRVVDMREGVAA
jgi:hypothetical protein